MTSLFTAHLGRLQREVPRYKPRLEDCYFYHLYDLGNGTTVGGPGAAYDLRGRFNEYIGGYDLGGKTVFDFGTASGFLAFSAEQAGAKVTAFDTRSFYFQDRVPFDDYLYVEDKLRWAEEVDHGFSKLHNSFWYMWHHFGSSVEMVYGSTEDLILTSEKFDVVVAGAVMEHIADPITALGICARLAKEAIIVAFTPVHMTDEEYMKPLIPWNDKAYSYVWWALSKGLYDRVFNNLGFDVEYIPVSFEQVDGNNRTLKPEQTIIARRRKR